jgi:hypothetical protein
MSSRSESKCSASTLTRRLEPLLAGMRSMTLSGSDDSAISNFLQPLLALRHARFHRARFLAAHVAVLETRSASAVALSGAAIRSGSPPLRDGSSTTSERSGSASAARCGIAAGLSSAAAAGAASASGFASAGAAFASGFCPSHRSEAVGLRIGRLHGVSAGAAAASGFFARRTSSMRF